MFEEVKAWLWLQHFPAKERKSEKGKTAMRLEHNETKKKVRKAREDGGTR